MAHHPGVIVRLVHTRASASARMPTPDVAILPSGGQPRERLARMAARINGLETLVAGWRAGDPGASAITPSIVVTAWRDAELMVAALGRDEAGFLREHLGLAVETEGGESYEVISRTFGSLPVPNSVLRIVTMTARGSAEATLFERLREIQRWLTDHGLIASHVARRVIATGIEVAIVGVWNDHSAIHAATQGRPERSVFPDEIEPLIESSTVEMYDALEIAPRLPMSSGPPILVLDESRRIVDLTPAAAAILGRTQDEAVGMLVEDIAADGDRDGAMRLEPPARCVPDRWACDRRGRLACSVRWPRDDPLAPASRCPGSWSPHDPGPPTPGPRTDRRRARRSPGRRLSGQGNRLNAVGITTSWMDPSPRSKAAPRTIATGRPVAFPKASSAAEASSSATARTVDRMTLPSASG
jgi:PAS domain-containing protein